MATGDQQDMLARLRGALPPWFGDGGPVLAALLGGLAQAAAFFYGLYGYIRLQTRIVSATDDNLDIIAADFFGNGLIRRAGQSDTSYRNTIRANLLRERGTRRGMALVLQQLTGRTPLIVEPGRPADFGGYGLAFGYGAGAYGYSAPMRYQAFLTAYRPRDGSGAPGYGDVQGGYGAALAYGASNVQMDVDIVAAVESVRPIGTVSWLRVSN